MEAESVLERDECPTCGARVWDDLLVTHSGRVMLSDQRVLEGELHKVRCVSCGLVANRRPFTDAELHRLYSWEYELNTTGREEHLFFTPEGPLPRSELFFERIRPLLPPGADSLLEVGCGEGNLLARLSEVVHGVRGIDGSARAVELARGRGLDVSQALIAGEYSPPPADVVVCVGVLEHVEDPSKFLRRLRSAVAPGGRLILSVPLQDHFSCDLFFHDHIWHFDAARFEHLLRNVGLRVVASECDHPVNPVMGLFACEPVANWDANAPAYGWTGDASTIAVVNRDTWLRRFERANAWLERCRPERLAVFGGGETLALFWAYSSLADCSVVACLDDDANKIGGQRFGVPIERLEWLAEGAADAVFLAVNPVYQERVCRRISEHVAAERAFTWGTQEAVVV
jgi:SAM-dependent methyltransferase